MSDRLLGLARRPERGSPADGLLRREKAERSPGVSKEARSRRAAEWVPRSVGKAVDPPVEAEGGGEWVECSEGDDLVLRTVEEHVDEDASYLTSREEVAAMVAVAEDPSGRALEQPVEAEREADAEASHPGGERRAVGRLDDEVDVILLDGVVNDLEPVDVGSEEDLPQRLTIRSLRSEPTARRNVTVMWDGKREP
jgi:hypothetical protein